MKFNENSKHLLYIRGVNGVYLFSKQFQKIDLVSKQLQKRIEFINWGVDNSILK